MDFFYLGLKWKLMEWGWRGTFDFFKKQYRSIGIDRFSIRFDRFLKITYSWRKIAVFGIKWKHMMRTIMWNKNFPKNRYRSINIDRSIIDFYDFDLNILSGGSYESSWGADLNCATIFIKSMTSRSILIYRLSIFMVLTDFDRVMVD